MKLYYAPGACSLAVRIILNELGIESAYESVNLKTKKTQKGDDFLKINPKGAVPVLCLDNHEILTENAAIQQYLADNFKGGDKLLPKIGDFERYRVLEWLNFISTDLHKGFAPIFLPIMPNEVKDSILRPMMVKKLEWVDKQLGQKPFILGENFTLADAYLFVVLTWAEPLGVDIKSYQNLQRYIKELKERASVKKSLLEEKNGQH